MDDKERQYISTSAKGALKKYKMEQILKEEEEKNKFKNEIKDLGDMNKKQLDALRNISLDVDDPDYIRGVMRKKKSVKSKSKRCYCK